MGTFLRAEKLLLLEILEVAMSKVVILMVGILLLVGWWWRARKAEPEAARATDPALAALTDQQWKARLSPEAYRILRHEATERPGSSPLDKEKRAGEFLCAGCQNVLFRSSDKFDSGTGWPSFTGPAGPEGVGSKTDYKMLVARTEVHCARCGGHLGHVFSDGPAPTGKRYCINGAALEFRPAQGAPSP